MTIEFKMTKAQFNVGCILPTRGSKAHIELTTILPSCITPLLRELDIRKGTIAEFTDAISQYKPHIDHFAAEKVNLIHPEGTPPFMLLGYDGERRIVENWRKETGIEIFTSGMSQIEAMRALSIKRFVGVGYDFEDTSIVSRYFSDAGFDVLGLERPVGVPWEMVGDLGPDELVRLIKDLAAKHPAAEGVYIQGGGWRTLHIIERLEDELKLPVAQPVAVRCWDIQRRLGVHEPKHGFGQLLSRIPS